MSRTKEILIEYPKFKSLTVHPDPTKHFYLVTLKDLTRHGVAYGTLKEWMNKYAR